MAMMEVKYFAAKGTCARILVAAMVLAGCDGATEPRDTTPPVVTTTSPQFKSCSRENPIFS